MNIQLKLWVSALRLRQWNKQALILLPLIALGNQLNFIEFAILLVVAFGFSLVASGVYLVNDLIDLEHDKNDSLKSHRPIASGKILPQSALIFAIVSSTTGIFLVFVVTPQHLRVATLGLLLIYLVINIAYSSLRLKRFKLLGVLCVATGFSIRFAIGTVLLGLQNSAWAYVLILQLAMVMLSGKRFQTSHRKFGQISEKNPRGFEEIFWLFSMASFVAFFAATYSGFISDPSVIVVWGRNTLIYSIIPLALGLVRYIEIVLHSEKYIATDVTESMIRDPFLIIMVAAFIATMFFGRLSG